jgi:L-lactate dehydrogenase complex protein LldF
MSTPRQAFHQRVQASLANPFLQIALDNNAERRKAGMQQSFTALGVDPDELRRRARAIRQHTLDNLDAVLTEFVANVRAHGFQVHWARDAAEAQAHILEIAQAWQARTVAKSKSMVSEEIHLNHALEQANLRVVETDLGEFIVQLRKETPSHIITPAVHLRREDVAETFNQLLDMPYTTDIRAMNDVAHHELRQVFLTAEVGFSGVNFGVAETGTLVLVTNEGNGRMCTTVPPVHIALMGIERLLPTLEDLDLMLQLLPRSATGQKLSTYTSLIQSPRQANDPDGPQERHLVLVDNGRRQVAAGALAEILLCIRCGACLNTCPVFREIGGHAYASAYSGPIGAVISPALFGAAEFGHLAKASTLCGACVETCPVHIDFPSLLLRVRDQYVRAVPQPLEWRLGMRLFAWAVARPQVYRLGQKLAALGTRLIARQDGWIRRLPPPLNGWTDARDFPAFSPRTFRERFKAARPAAQHPAGPPPAAPQPAAPAAESAPAAVAAPAPAATRLERIDRLESELRALGAELIRCRQAELPNRVAGRLLELDARTLLAWEDESQPSLPEVNEHLRQNGFTLLSPKLMLRNPARQEGIHWLSQAQAGLTGAAAALANTGTVIVSSGAQRSQLASLLPPVHLAILHSQDIYPDFAAWLANGGKALIAESQNVSLISGPSRTADIEMTLTIGVHGPGQLIVFCVLD